VTCPKCSQKNTVPSVEAAAAQRQPHVPVFGDDYPTPDGTPIRDYIHVRDLGTAHVLALEHLLSGKDSDCVNLGNGTGYSVLEVIEAARQVTGTDIKVNMLPRRPGDPSHLVADPGRAKQVLRWAPETSDLKSIIQSAWDWHSQQPQGYE